MSIEAVVRGKLNVRFNVEINVIAKNYVILSIGKNKYTVEEGDVFAFDMDLDLLPAAHKLK